MATLRTGAKPGRNRLEPVTSERGDAALEDARSGKRRLINPKSTRSGDMKTSYCPSEKPTFQIVFPHPENLDDAEKAFVEATPNRIDLWPVRMGFRSAEDALAVVGGKTSTTSEPAPHIEALSRDIASLIVKHLPHTAPDPYHVENLPPGATKRAFQDAVRRGDVVAARVGGRALVEVADWNEYKKNRRRRKQPRKATTRAPHQLGHEGAVANDADLFAAVGARRTK